MDSSTIVFVLLILSVIALAVGLIRPQSFSWLLGKSVNRIRAGIVFFLTSIGLLYALGAVSPDVKVEDNTVPDMRDQINAQKIPYAIVKEWDRKESGAGKLIVINSRSATKDSMIKLGLQLKEEFKDKENVIVLVYTDADAAKQRDSFSIPDGNGGTINLVDTYRVGLFSTIDEGANLQAPEGWEKAPTAAYDKSFIGLYRKGQIYGKHQWVIQLSGVWDMNKEAVNY